MKVPLLRHYLVTGVLVLLPLLVTVYVLVVIVQFAHNLMGKYFDTIGKQVFTLFLMDTRFDGFGRIIFARDVSPFGMMLTLVIVLLVGFAATTVLGRRIFHYGEGVITKLPIAKVVYPSAKQFLDFFVQQQRRGFNKVVLVEYPRKGVWMMGFQTGQAPEAAEQAAGRQLVNIFLPFTPPASGVIILVPEEEVIAVDLPVDDAFRLLISAGVLTPPEEQEAVAVPR